MKKLFFLLPFLLLCTSTLQAQRTLIGTTSGEGKDFVGSIFSLPTGDNTITQEFNFITENLGGSPNADLCQATNGKFYGMTVFGGIYERGVIFEYDLASNTYTKKIDFDNVENGCFPYGSLIQASDGKLYGMTAGGGINNYGVLFEYDISTNKCIKRIDFDSMNKGGIPFGSLLQASNGKLYGMTSVGGANNFGVIFEYDISAHSYTKKIDFDGANNGAVPFGSLVQASNGNLYGLTGSGGANGVGVLFEYSNTTNTITKKTDFDDANNGSVPLGSLIQATNGKLYGMTSEGGANGWGVLFEYDITNELFFSKIDFGPTSKGRTPNGSLLQASNGKLYGTTSEGGTKDLGIIFEFDAVANLFTKKIDFSNIDGDGSYATGSLVQANNGKLYGMTSTGGINNTGVIYEFDATTVTYTKKIDFNGVDNGKNSVSSLVQANTGKVYGMTSRGGANDNGVLFEYAVAYNTYTKKINFDGKNKGSKPCGSLLQASNGDLYGMTSAGGANDAGVLFEYDIITNSYTKKIDFGSANTGSFPYGSLIQANNGKMYGMTGEGGLHDSGILFEYNITNNAFVKKIDFDSVGRGRYPHGSLLQANNGRLYGMTFAGGANDAGVLFEYDIVTNVLTKKIDFDGDDRGAYPYGDLVQANNGKLYGMTLSGGLYSKGVLFEYDIATNLLTKKIDFDGADKGGLPYGSLLQSNNGKLYGMTAVGGANNSGVLFEYDIATNSFINQIDFTDGARPKGSLIEVILPDAGLFNQTVHAIPFTVYPNPNSGTCTINSTVSGIYQICNQLGQVIQRIDLEQNSVITVSNLPAGIYCIKSDAGSVQQKIVVY